MVDYYEQKGEFDEYEFSKKRRRESFLRPDEFDEFKEPEIREVTLVKRRSMPRMEETKLEPMKRDLPQVFGSLFDRVDFLKARIEETEKTIIEREKLHNQFLKEIENDINSREDMLSHITDIDEKRNFQLDMSILRKERRQENVQFWRDVLELRTELRELMEKLETEENILEAFKKIEGGEDG